VEWLFWFAGWRAEHAVYDQLHPPRTVIVRRRPKPAWHWHESAYPTLTAVEPEFGVMPFTGEI
jgi:hypothetical protein